MQLLRGLKYPRPRDPFYRLTWVNYDPNMISNQMPSKMQDEFNYPFTNFNGRTVDVWEWISNFIPHFIMGVIACPCWD